jgi:abhydrolase domain-containing protein 12
LDYRGYGDSTGTPNEKDIVKDSQFTYEYIRQVVPGSYIYIWGHSLGSGVSSHLGKILHEKEISPNGIILESPFFNIFDEIKLHPLAKV